MGTIAAVLGGLLVLERAADRFTSAVGALARRLDASQGTVGLLTAGGEWEELVVVVVALARGHAGIAAGNVIGACLANLVGSMPLGLLGRPLVPDRSARVYGLVLVAVTLLVAAVSADGTVSPPAGGVLIVVFALYAVSVVVVVGRGLLRPAEDDDDDDEEMTGSTGWIVLTLAVSLAVIGLAAETIVPGAAHVARQVGLSEYAIGATVIAVGTTLPDKAISLLGGLRGQSGVVTANAVGSNIFVLTLVLGIAAAFNPGGLVIGSEIVAADLPLLVAATILVVALFFRRSLDRRVAIALLVLYVGYLTFAFARG